MTLQLAPPALILIQPYQGAIHRLDGGQYRLMHGLGQCVVLFLVNLGPGPATVAGCIAGAAGTLVIEARNAFMIGWDFHGTTWRAVRMCGVRIAGPEGFLVDVQPGPVPPDATFLFEDLAGTAAWASLSTIAAYLAGVLPTLAGLQPPVWKGPS